MTQIVASGTLNTSALTVPDLYVTIQAPAPVLNGVPSNVIGVVGTASWGPVNQPIVLGSLAQYVAAFGPVGTAKYDMGTPVSTAAQQGASSFVGVRVTDGTDAAATYAILYQSTTHNYPMMVTALYTGATGNSIGIVLQAGSKAGTWQIVLAMPGQPAEVFDNLPATTPATFWAAAVSAINNGQSALRGPSRLCVATLGTATTVAPSTITSQSLIGGTNGTDNVVSSTLTGADGATRTGMYALRGQGASILVHADCDDLTQWGSVQAFCQSEGAYGVLTGPSGDTISNAASSKASAGIDTYALKVMHGDWLYWYDASNSQTRLVSPQGFAAGKLAALSPEQSSLNKPLVGIIGSQKAGLASTGQVTTYSAAELSLLVAAGIDVICNPAPGGAYWACRIGHNASSSAAVYSDSYTRMTNFLAATLAAGMGQYVGATINDTLLNNIRTTLLSFLSNMLGQGLLGLQGGKTPYAVSCSSTNNPQTRTALGYVQADVAVQYQGINEKFLVNLQAGAGVTISSTSGN